MKHLLATTTLVSLLTLSSTALLAGDKHHKRHNQHRFDDTARVTHVEPIYTSVRVASPRRECRSHNYHRSDYQPRESYTTTIAGGIIGGVLGNQLGGGNGKKILTVAGVLLGGSIGRDLGYQAQPTSRYNRGDECRTVQSYHQEQRIDGYQVTYRYQGQTYTSRMDYDPGNRLPVEVSVRPASRRYY
ncbi:MAG: glycine zipper 2TM domain-containing protein [Piscirickettsiaceae bacterium]|nr:glycine zipper 2TM domain-containing protein [Piscirickettsiaceae bacterium]